MEEEKRVVDPLRGSTICIEITLAFIWMENEQNLRIWGGEEKE